MKIFLLFLLFLSSFTFANSSVVVRPQIGYGQLNLSEADTSEPISHAGIRVLLKSGKTQRYGLEATQFKFKNKKTDKEETFNAVGLVIEKVMGSFHMSIGTVGYFNYNDVAGNPVGLMSNLGWEPKNYKSIKPFVTYRSDVISADTGNTDTINSLSIGFTF